MVEFPAKKWSAAIAEIMEYLDLTPYSKLSCDIFILPDAPDSLKAKIILTVGDDWKWTEMSRAVKLEPGKWTTITADLAPGSVDWKRTQVTDEFRADVRKMDIRIESNGKTEYKGPIYIDNVRVE